MADQGLFVRPPFDRGTLVTETNEIACVAVSVGVDVVRGISEDGESHGRRAENHAVSSVDLFLNQLPVGL